MSSPAPIHQVTHIDDPRVLPFSKVRDRDLKRCDGLFLGEGPLTVERMLENPGVTQSILVAERWKDRFSAASLAGVEVNFASEAFMGDLIGFPFHRGVMAAGRRDVYEGKTLNDILETQNESATLLLVDGVTNVDNIGLLFRNAAAFGCSGVVLSQQCCDPLYRKALRVSLGHVLSLPWCAVADWTETLDVVKESEFMIVAAALSEGAMDVDTLERNPRLALVVGQEAHGVSSATLNACDQVVKIPMADGVDSLNVAAASAVCLHVLRI